MSQKKYGPANPSHDPRNPQVPTHYTLLLHITGKIPQSAHIQA